MADYPRTTWRLIQSQELNGAMNMAIDEAILEAVIHHESPPTLRLYAWNPPCLSLGIAQPAAEVNIQKLTELGWDLVRRPTGGRAILHTDELTYSVTGLTTDTRLAGGVLESYRNLSAALLNTLLSLGIPAKINPKIEKRDPEWNGISGSKTRKINPICFEVPSDYEITVKDKKIIGSAQARRNDGVLQHGSIPLHGDLSRITWVLNDQNDEALLSAGLKINERAATIEEILGQEIHPEVVGQALVDSFSGVLNLDFMHDQLSQYESELADTLVAEKYGNSSWTYRI